MENLISATVEVMLDGKPYQLRYRAFAFITYAEKTGRDLLVDLQEIGQGLNAMEAAKGGGGSPPLGPIFGKIRDVLWAGLVDLQPEVRQEQVARMFGFRELTTVAPLMMQAINMTLPEQPARPIPAANSHDLALTAGVGSGPSSEIPPG